MPNNIDDFVDILSLEHMTWRQYLDGGDQTLDDSCEPARYVGWFYFESKIDVYITDHGFIVRKGDPFELIYPQASDSQWIWKHKGNLYGG